MTALLRDNEPALSGCAYKVHLEFSPCVFEGFHLFSRHSRIAPGRTSGDYHEGHGRQRWALLSELAKSFVKGFPFSNGRVHCFWQLHLAHFGGLFWPPCKRASKSLIPGHLLSFLGTWSGAEPEGRSAGRCPQKRAPSLLPPSLLLRQRPTKAVGLLARLDDVSAVGNAIQQRLT